MLLRPCHFPPTPRLGRIPVHCALFSSLSQHLLLLCFAFIYRGTHSVTLLPRLLHLPLLLDFSISPFSQDRPGPLPRCGSAELIA